MKINFTKEHEDRLKSLFLELGFSGEVLAGKFNANNYTVWDLLHNCSISSLKGININLKKEVVALEEQDEWSLNAYQMQKAAKTKKWGEYVNLLIGYKLNEAENETIRIKERKEKEEKLNLLMSAKKVKQIENINKLSEEELEAEIAKLS